MPHNPFVKVTSWNAKVNRKPGEMTDDLRQLMEDTDPDVILLQESEDYVPAIRDRFDGHWFTYAHKGWDESWMNPVMVRCNGRDQQKFDHGWGVLRTTTKWTGPKGGTHKGRTWTWVNVDGVLVCSLHRCTDGNGKNKQAFQDEADLLERWIDAQERPVLIIGDHNCGVNKTHPGASKTIAQGTGSKLTYDPDDPGIDYAIRNGIDGTLNRKGKAYGSDHHPVVFHRT